MGLLSPRSKLFSRSSVTHSDASEWGRSILGVIRVVFFFLLWADPRLITSPNFVDLPLSFRSFVLAFPLLGFPFLLFSRVASVSMTKTGVAKDQHDMPMRVCNAKDLRGKIGLTTALRLSDRYVQFF